MVAEETLDPVTERLIRAWHDAQAIREMPELFMDDKLAEIAGAVMSAIEEAWQALGHTKRELDDLCQHLASGGKLENWAGRKHFDLER